MTGSKDTGTLLADQLVYETIDGETVVIDLATGSYYSLEGAAAVAWQGLVAADDVAVTAARIAQDNGATTAAVLPALSDLYGELHAMGLLRSAPVCPAGDAGPPSANGAAGFSIPPVQRYDDMREHLLVDPIHQVERGEGWPTPASR
ncbi:MAG: hypothetical protein ABSH51_03350 [Solirubrobacteraceae bacterium]|jgi:hypothetical protein